MKPFRSFDIARTIASRVLVGVAAAAVAIAPAGVAGAVPPASAPSAPATPTATYYDHAATVSFLAPANGGSAITGYTVTAADVTTPTNGGQTCAATNPATACTVSGLTNGDSYTFTVTATNAVGTSAASSPSNAVTPGPVTTTQVAANNYGSFTCALLSNGTVDCWGYNGVGQLGDASTTDSSTPVTVYAVGSTSSSHLLTGVSAITAGENYACALLATGGVDCWGYNANGQLGNNSTTGSNTPVAVYAVGSTSSSNLLTGVSAIAAGQNDTCAQLATGGVDCWGYNGYGQLGINSTTESNTPVAVYAVGSTSSSNLLTGVSAITAGANHTCALLTTGGVDCWGNNYNGELGINSTTESNTPVAVVALAPTGVSGSAAIDSSVVTWVGSSGSVSYTVAATDSTTVANGGQTCTSATTSCTVSGLTSGDSYTFSVTASNGIGLSAASAASSAVVPVGLTPSTPSITNLPSSGTFGGSFTPTVSTSGDGTTSVTSSTTSVCTVAGSGLVSFIGTGTCTLVAHVGTGTNYASADGIGQDITIVSAKPGAPTITSVTRGNAQATITWTDGAANGSDVTSQTIYVYEGSTLVTIKTDCSGSPCTVTGLTNGTSYTFKVSDTNHVGEGALSAASSAVIPLPAPLLTSVVRGKLSLVPHWLGVTVAHGTVLFFTATAHDLSGNVAGTCTTKSGFGRSCRITGLTGHRTYEVSVTATLRIGAKATGHCALISPPSNQVVGIPLTPVYAGNSGGVVVSWF